jgi:uncharacterized repeat protein (TIGR01451 family)
MRQGLLLVLVLGGLLMTWAGVLSAEAATPGPGWEVSFRSVPTNFSSPPSKGFPDGYNIVVRNAGSQPATVTPITIVDRLPQGITAIEATAYEVEPVLTNGLPPSPEELAGACTITLNATVVTCVDSQPSAGEKGPLGPGGQIYVNVTVALEPGTPDGELDNTVTVSGGGAPPIETSEPTTVNPGQASFGFESFTMREVGLNGATDAQAGDHPYESTTTLFFHTKPESGSESVKQIEAPRDVVADLPPGFVGNPQVVPKCPQEAAIRGDCQPSTQIGYATVFLQEVGHEFKTDPTVPIYNVVTNVGVAAQFVLLPLGVPALLQATVSQDTNYAVRVTASGIPRLANLTGISLTFFGEPLTNPNVYNKSVGAQPLAFLQNPVNCSAGPLRAAVSADSWQHPGSYLPDGAPNLTDPSWKTITATVYPQITGCDMLQFGPSLAVIPDSARADEPTGATFDLHLPQSTDKFPALATPELREATVTLPAGMSISPSAADGLQGCSDAEIALASSEPATCPEASVLGTVRVSTPLLADALEGRVFLGTPNCDPCMSADAADGNMVRIFLEVAGDGVRLKKQGTVYVNPSSGQLTTRFTEIPELPFGDLLLRFKGGLRAGLATPQSCGAAMTTSDLVPWSSPVTPDATPPSSFAVDWDGNGGACPASLPLAPSFSAGTSNPNAGQYSPLTVTFNREDREQYLTGIQVRTPPGLLGTLTGVPLCEEPQANLGVCSQASRIGTMTVAVGPGGHPFYVPGLLYLTGPYKGGPFGLSIVVPAVAGPFNLGNVVVRARIDVDPETAALTVTSDPLPQVIDGIPLRLHTANVTVDRPGFIFNPTNCAQQRIAATIAGAQGAQANTSVPFAVSGCAGLHFKPAFKAQTSGHTSRKGGASLYAKLTIPAGKQSNIAKTRVELPRALPARLSTLQKACLAATFAANPAACPAASLVGYARVSTPLLPVVLTGPAYFVSYGSSKFPELIVVLQGYGIRVDLHGETFISKHGITSSTFANVPDAPFNSFELYLPQGPHSALAANGNLCAQKLTMPTIFTAQDGAKLKQSTKIAVTGCPKASRAAKVEPARGAASRHAGGKESG